MQFPNSYHTVRIGRKKILHQSLNSRLLSLILTIFNSTNCCVLYKLSSTITTSWFWFWWASNFLTLLKTVAESCVFRLDEWKQKLEVDSGGAWNDPSSSTMPYPSGIFNCHGDCACFNGEESSKIFHLLASTVHLIHLQIMIQTGNCRKRERLLMNYQKCEEEKLWGFWENCDFLLLDLWIVISLCNFCYN